VPKPRKRTGFPWKPVAVYIAVVAAAGTGLILWDRAYQAREEFSAAPRPETVAKSVVEGFVGAGTVQSVKLDQRTGTLTMEVKDVVTDKNKTAEQNRSLLSGQGTQAAQRILGLISFKRVDLRFVRNGKLLATVRAEPGKTPETIFAPDFK